MLAKLLPLTNTQFRAGHGGGLFGVEWPTFFFFLHADAAGSIACVANNMGTRWHDFPLRQLIWSKRGLG